MTVKIDAPQVKNVTFPQSTFAKKPDLVDAPSGRHEVEESVASHCTPGNASPAWSTLISRSVHSENVKGTVYSIMIGSEKMRCSHGIPNSKIS